MGSSTRAPANVSASTSAQLLGFQVQALGGWVQGSESGRAPKASATPDAAARSVRSGEAAWEPATETEAEAQAEAHVEATETATEEA